MTVETNSFAPPWTILKVLDWSRGYFEQRGIESPRLDAELLLGHALGMQRVQLYAQFDRPLDADELAGYRELVKRRALGEPVAYLIGRKGFWTFEVEVDVRVLIPRPETERLVEVVLQHHPEPKRIVDVGTGSGIIAIALSLECPNAEIVACDLSDDALQVAQVNVNALAPTITVTKSDLLQSVEGSFDLIVSNPPYIAHDDSNIEKNVAAHEPEIALFASGGTAIYERLIPSAFARLQEGGWFATEIGHDQAQWVGDQLEAIGFDDVVVFQDLNGIDRVVIGRK